MSTPYYADEIGPHGTKPTYRAGCRCLPCTAANTTYVKQLRLDHLRGHRRTIDGTGTRRRLLALGVMGWSHARLAAHMGVTKRQIAQLIDGSGNVHRATAVKVDALYDALSMSRGPGDHRVADAALARGGHPPLAWNDIDDPDETPDVGAPNHGVHPDDVAWIITTGGTWEALTARTGLQRDSIRMLCNRAGRADLVARLKRLGEAV